MHHSWRVQSQRRVRPAVVIQRDALNGCLAGLPFTFEIRIQPIFLFQDLIWNPASQSFALTVGALGKTGALFIWEAMRLMLFAEAPVDVL